MKLIETFEIKEFKVDLYSAEGDLTGIQIVNLDKINWGLYHLMVEKRYLQVNFGALRDYIKKSFSNIALEEDDDVIGISLLTVDSKSQGEVKIKQTQKGYKIDCLELTTQETKELYLQINKFIRNYERSSDDKN